jgi:hypothetical protein
MTPFDEEFEKLPRKEQAALLINQFGWSREAIEDEYGVTSTTVKRWLNPTYAQRQREYSRQWAAGPGKESEKRRSAKYRASAKGKATDSRALRRRKETKAANQFRTP